MNANILAIFLLAIVFFPGNALAVGLSISPSEISMSGEAGERIASSVTVTNTSDESAVFEAYPDGLAPMLDVSPGSFALGSGESREIAVSMEAPGGRFATMISVTAVPQAGSGLKAAAGVKIPLRASFGADKSGLLANIGGILGSSALPIGAGVVALAVFLRFFKVSPRRRED